MDLTMGNAIGLSRISKQRRSFIERTARKRISKILEVGAFDNPTFRRDLGDDVRYLDFFSAGELCEMHRDNPRRNFDAVVEVDYVIKSSRFAARIDEKFDVVVANHVVEHIADLIFWFQEVQALLTGAGMLFVAVPDRRYTFDYFRPESLATHLIRAHQARLEKPDTWHLVEHFYYHQKVDVAKIWAGHLPGSFKPRFSLVDALAMAERKSREYTDAHCYVFTPRSFQQCIDDLRSAELVKFHVHAMEEPQFGSNEFWAILRA